MRVLQLNLWNTNEPLAERMQILEDGIAALQPDVITLQEVSPIAQRLQIAGIAERMGFYCYYADAGSFRGRREGNAILSKVPAVGVDTFNLSCPEVDLQRVAVCCQFDQFLERRLAIVATHLAYPLDADSTRAAQAEEVARFIKAKGADCSFILGADLNAEPLSEAVRTLIERLNAVDAWEHTTTGGPNFTFASENPFVESRLGPDRRIDYLMIGGSLSVTLCEAVFTESRLGLASDHYGVFAEIVGT